LAHNGGRLNANLWFNNNYYGIWALNACKQQGQGIKANQAGDTTYPTLLNANGYPTAMPSVGTWGFPFLSIWGNVNDEWDFFWPSQHTITLTGFGNLTLTDISGGLGLPAGQKRFRMTGTQPWQTFGDGTSEPTAAVAMTITAMSGNDWTGGIILSAYKIGGVVVNHKALLDAGEIYTPDFLARMGYGSGLTPFGMVRMMDWMGTNVSSVRLAAHRHALTDYSWTAALTDARFYAGLATKSLNDYTTLTRLPGNPTTWTDGQPVQFYMPSPPTTLTCTVTLANPTSFNCTAHGLTTGKKIECAQESTGTLANLMRTKSSSTGLPPEYAITKIDNNNFTIAVDSSALTAGGSFMVIPSCTVTDGFLAAKRFYRAGFTTHYNSEWGANFPSGGVITGTYFADFDAISMTGDRDYEINPGPPPEALCALANKLKSHLWINTPFSITGSELQTWLQLFHTNLSSELQLIIEYSNETWNSGFMANGQLTSYGAFKTGVLNSAYGLGYKITDLASNAATALGGTGRTYKLVMAPQNVSSYASNVDAFKCGPISGYVNPGTPGNSALYPLNLCDVLATAPYITVNFLYAGNAATYPGFQTAMLAWKAGNTSTAYDWLQNELLVGAVQSGFSQQQPLSVHISTYIPQWVTGKSAFTGRSGGGIEYWNYEGGNGIPGSDNIIGGFPTGGITVQNVRDFYIGYLASSQHAFAVSKIMNDLKNAGTTWPSQYAIIGPWTNGATWGSQRLNDFDTAATPQWTALYNWNKGYTTWKFTTS